jgi:hypothetical protein
VSAAGHRCDRCGQGYMKPTGFVLAVDPPLFPHRCTRCGYVEHYRKVYNVPDEQPTEETTTTTAETVSELTVDAEAPAVHITAGSALLPLEALAGGGGVTVTISTTVNVVVTPPKPIEPQPAAEQPRRHIGGRS